MAQLCWGCGGEGTVQTRPSKRSRHLHRAAVQAAAVTGVPPPTPPRATAQCGDCRGLGITQYCPRDLGTDADTGSSAHPDVSPGVEAACEKIGCHWCCDQRRAGPHSGNNQVDVAIIGGGIGGLAAAIALRQRGIHATVYERDSHFGQRRHGYGLTMQQGSKALAQLGVDLDGIVSTAHFSLTPAGELLGCYGRAVYYRAHDAPDTHDPGDARDSGGPRVEGTGVSGSLDVGAESTANDPGRSSRRAAAEAIPKDRQHNIHVPRQALRKALLDCLPEDAVCWSQQFEGYSQHPETGIVTARFAHGVSVDCRLLVGADGIFSAVRAQKAPTPPLQYLQVVVVLGYCQCAHPLAQGRIFQTLDGETRIYAMPFASPKAAIELGLVDPDHAGPFVMWQLSFPVASEDIARKICRSPAALKEAALTRCGKWHTPIPSLLADTPESCISGHPVWDRAPSTPEELRGKAESHVTVLGDAAHPMSPFKGQGANQALLDAVLLAKALFRTDLAHSADCSVVTSAEVGARDPKETRHLERGCTWRRQQVTVSAALVEYESEMLQRSEVKVKQSRDAAASLHSAAALEATSCTRAAAARGASSCISDDDLAWARLLLRSILGKPVNDSPD